MQINDIDYTVSQLQGMIHEKEESWGRYFEVIGNRIGNLFKTGSWINHRTILLRISAAFTEHNKLSLEEEQLIRYFHAHRPTINRLSANAIDRDVVDLVNRIYREAGL